MSPTPDDDRDSDEECPDCGRDGQMSRGPDLFYCPDCEITYDADGSTDVPQFDAAPRSQFQPPK